MDVSVIVPCYNEQDALPAFYKEVLKVLKGIKVSYELILVNDGSNDDIRERNYKKRHGK